MKLYSNTLLPVLGKATLKELTTITRETLDMITDKKKTGFTAAQLWNIQKQKRSIASRRFV